MKPIKPNKSKLALRHETIRNLDAQQLGRIRGGLSPLSVHSLCDTWTALCTFGCD